MSKKIKNPTPQLMSIYASILISGILLLMLLLLSFFEIIKSDFVGIAIIILGN